MRKRRMTRGAVAVIVICGVAALVVVGLLAANWLQPTPAISFFDTDQYYRIADAATDAAMEAAPDAAPEPHILAAASRPEPGRPSEAPPSFSIEPQDILPEKLPDVRVTSLPARFLIPALSLNYPVQGTGADASGTMQVAPALEVVSWFTLSAVPGNQGNAIFGAHNTWGGVPSRVFTLDQLEIGDELIIIYDDGSSLRFFLESVFVYPLVTAPANLIMDVRGEARVTLITCKWPFSTVMGTSENRIVATFRQDSVFVVPDPPIEPFPPRIPGQT